jgi:hypothetical protein
MHHPLSLPGLTRQSIFLAKRMDPRVKPAGDTRELDQVRRNMLKRQIEASIVQLNLPEQLKNCGPNPTTRILTEGAQPFVITVIETAAAASPAIARMTSRMAGRRADRAPPKPRA